MKTTGKWIIAGLVMALYPLTAWLMGYSIERNIAAALAQLHEKAPYVTVGARQFKRGWYRSEQDLTLELFHGTPGVGRTPLQLTVHSDIFHGPLCGITCIGRARIESHFVFDGGTGQKLAGLFGDAEPVHAHTVLGFFGGSTTTVTSPAIGDKTLDDGSKITWEGFEATTTGDDAGDRGTLHGSAPRLAIALPDGKRFEASAMAVDSNSQRVLRSLFGGDGSLAVGKFTVGAGPNSVTIENLRSETHNTASNGFMSLRIKTGTGAVTTAPLTLTGIHVDFTLRHLEVESLESLLTALREANQTPATTTGGQLTAVQHAFADKGMALLSHAPEITLDRISASTASGAVLITGSVRLADTTPADFAAGTNPGMLLPKLEATIDASADDAFVKALPGPGASLESRLLALVPSGIVTFGGGKFHTKIALRHGQTTFNGQAIQPPPR